MTYLDVFTALALPVALATAIAYVLLIAMLKRRFSDMDLTSPTTYRGAARTLLAPWRYGLCRHSTGALFWFDGACPCVSGHQAAIRVMLISWQAQLLVQSLLIGATVVCLAGPAPAAAGILIGFLANVGRNAMRNSRRAGMPGFLRSFVSFALAAIGRYRIGQSR